MTQVYVLKIVLSNVYLQCFITDKWVKSAKNAKKSCFNFLYVLTKRKSVCLEYQIGTHFPSLTSEAVKNTALSDLVRASRKGLPLDVPAHSPS